MKAADAKIRRKQSQCGIEVCDGITSAKNINGGELLMPGMRLLTIEDDSQIWVIANFRESQIEGIKPGSKVDIKVDAFVKRSFTAK